MNKREADVSVRQREREGALFLHRYVHDKVSEVTFFADQCAIVTGKREAHSRLRDRGGQQTGGAEGI